MGQVFPCQTRPGVFIRQRAGGGNATARVSLKQLEPRSARPTRFEVQGRAEWQGAYFVLPVPSRSRPDQTGTTDRQTDEIIEITFA